MFFISIPVLILPWVKVFRIIPEFRIFRRAFHRKSAIKILNLADSISFSDLFSVYLKAVDHLNLKLLVF